MQPAVTIGRHIRIDKEVVAHGELVGERVKVGRDHKMHDFGMLG